jgi:serine/threonine-protein kinase
LGAEATTLRREPQRVPAPQDAHEIRSALSQRYVQLTDWSRSGNQWIARAYDARLQREVDLHARAIERDRGELERALEQIAAFRSPNVAELYDVELLEHSVVLITRAAPRETLEEALRGLHLTLRQALEVLERAGNGIAAAHRSGLAHGSFGLQTVRVDPSADPPEVCVVGFEFPVFEDSVADDLSRTADLGHSEDGLPSHAARVDEDVRRFCQAVAEAVRIVGPDSPGHRRLRRRLSPLLEATTRPESMGAILGVLRASTSTNAAKWIAVAGTLAVAASAIGIVASTRERCADRIATIEDVWSEPRRQEVRAALLATELPYAGAAFDAIDAGSRDYQAAWIEGHTQACALPQTATSPLPSRVAAMDCLHIGAHRFASVIDILSDADRAIAERAWTIIAELPPAAQCVEPSGAGTVDALPRDTLRASEVRDIRAELAEAASLVAAARYEAAATVHAQALRRAELSMHSPTLVEALRIQAQLELAWHGPSHAEEPLSRAWRVALASHRDRDATTIAADLGTILATTQPTPDRGEALAKLSLALAERPSAGAEEHAAALASLAEVASARGDYARELELLERSIAILESRPQGAPAFEPARQRIGTALFRLGRYPQAEEWFRDDYRRLRETLTDTHPRTLRTRGNLALSLYAQGKYTEAIEEFRGLAEAQRQLLGPDHPDVAKTVSNLGSALNQVGHHDEGREAHAESLRIRELVFGPRHAEVAASLNNLGTTAWQQGDFELSRQYHRRALDIRRDILGPEHPDTGYSEQNLCLTERDLNNLDSALEHCLKGVEIFETALGPAHTNTASALTNLANLRLRLGQPEAALRAHQRALAIREKGFGAEHPEVGIALVNIAEVLLQLERNAEAHREAERAWSILEPTASPARLNAATLLVRTARATGARDTAVRMRQRAVELADELGASNVEELLHER